MCPDRKKSDPTMLSLPDGAPSIHLSTFRQDGINEAETCKPVTLIGSRRDCDLYIGNSDISKTHCALINTGASVLAMDLCTRAGTFVNGQQISAAALRSGDVLRIGTELVKVQFTLSTDGSNSSDCGSISERVLKTPLRMTCADQQYRIDILPLVIGRRHTCQVELDTPDVSLTHALVFSMMGRYAICDLGSRSGIYLNGQRAMLAWINNGDQLTIGGEKLVLSFDEPQQVHTNIAETGHGTESIDRVSTNPGVALSGSTDAFGASDGHAPEADALSEHTLEQRAAALDQRETELNERQSRLESTEEELNRRSADLARRENDNHLAALKITQLMDSFSEAWRAYSAGNSAASTGNDHGTRIGPTANPSMASSHSGTVPGEHLRSDDRLPAPLVDQTIFPNLDGTRPM